MNKIFAKRRTDYHRQNIKYLRYVFNDHFVLFLMILLAALAVQYVQFIQSHHLGLPAKLVLLVLVSLFALLPGRLASFLEPADKVFLLVKERAVQRHLRLALLSSLILPGLFMLVLVLIAAPLLNFGLPWLLLWFVLLLLIKAGILGFRLFVKLQNKGVLNWEGLIKYEENRKSSTLRLFALFTNVKGLKSHSHRRRYLDWLLPKNTMRTYEYLYARAFLRSGDYLGLTLRLFALIALVLIFLQNSLFAAVLVSLFNYLLIFQLIALREAFDYQFMTRIYPLRKKAETTAIQRILFRIFGSMTILELILAAIFMQNRWYLFLILAVNFLLMRFYVRLRLKK